MKVPSLRSIFVEPFVLLLLRLFFLSDEIPPEDDDRDNFRELRCFLPFFPTEDGDDGGDDFLELLGFFPFAAAAVESAAAAAAPPPPLARRRPGDGGGALSFLELRDFFFPLGDGGGAANFLELDGFLTCGCKSGGALSFLELRGFRLPPLMDNGGGVCGARPIFRKLVGFRSGKDKSGVGGADERNRELRVLLPLVDESGVCGALKSRRLRGFLWPRAEGEGGGIIIMELRTSSFFTDLR